MADVATPTERIGSAAGQASEALQDKAQEVSQQLRRSSGQAQQRAMQEVTTRSRQAGEQVEAAGRALRSSAEQLRSEGRDTGIGAIEQAAGKLDQLAEYLKTSDGERILGDLEDFGRRQPWAVILGGIAIGFAASRFLKASSGRRYETRRAPAPRLPTDGQAAPRPAPPSPAAGIAPGAGSAAPGVAGPGVDERLASSGYATDA